MHAKSLQDNWISNWLRLASMQAARTNRNLSKYTLSVVNNFFL